ncbi:MAG: hypothetical protein IT289_03455, partial [Oligoflexia bacterium]|nr:hypothetical protein [Oligoflexia bacterium]
SPRAGIIRTGQVFFDRPIKDELSLRGFQISQLVHEARHSDGHGPEAGMLHAACPDTHFAAGLPACDQYANGPYGMEAESLRRFRTALKGKITEVGLQFLMINELASRERILSKRAVDPTPESATISY